MIWMEEILTKENSKFGTLQRSIIIIPPSHFDHPLKFFRSYQIHYHLICINSFTCALVNDIVACHTTTNKIFSNGHFDFSMRLSSPPEAHRLGKSAFSRASGPTARDNRLSRAVVLYRLHGIKKTKNKIIKRIRSLVAAAAPGSLPSVGGHYRAVSTVNITKIEEN
jgi:hypothetical protein